MPSQITYNSNGVHLTQNPGDANYIQSDPFMGLSSPSKGLSFPSATTITLAPRTVSFQINTLGNSTHIYQSVLYEDIIALSLYFADWGFSYNTQEGAVHKITVTVPWDTISFSDFDESEFTSEQWEIIPKEVTRPLTNCGLFDSNGYGYFLPQVFKTAIDLAYKNNTATISAPAGVSFTGTLASFLPQANLILQMKRAGIQGTPSGTQVVKRTACVDINNVNDAFDTIADVNYRNAIVEYGTPNLIYSTTDLYNAYPIPDAVQVKLLPSYRKQITVGSTDQYNIFTYAGWRVQAPQIQFITRNKMVFQQLFEWDEWMQYLFFFVDASPANFPLVNTNPSGTGLPLV